MAASAVPGILQSAMDARTFHPDAEQGVHATDHHRLRLLIDTGLLLSSERNLDVIVQAALDAGLALCGAAYGAFFYNNLGADGEPYQLYKVSGVDPELFAKYPMPRPTTLFAPTFTGEAIVRCDDVTTDPRYGNNAPLSGMPAGHLKVRSYLAVPVRSLGGEVLGALLYGHPEVGAFQQELESLVATVAAQAAVAIDNFRLAQSLRREVKFTDAAKAEQRVADRRLRQALDATQLGTWSWSASTGLVDLDERAAELFAVAPHVPIPRARLRERIAKEDQQVSPEDLREVLSTGRKYAAEYRLNLPDGSQPWISASGSPSFSETTKRFIGMTGTVQDITQRKLQETLLRQNEKLAATGRLAATIAHEINNPLEAVTNLIYLAKTDPATPPGVQKLLETADSELARVSQIAQQTLGFYRDTTRPVTVDLNELLHAVVDLFGRKLAVKRLECKLDLDPGLSIIGLQGEIRQIVANLLVNAIDASPSDGGSIRIRARHRRCNGNHGIAMLIADQGSGIPHHVRHRLFTPFVTTKQSVGTGLGLWVTRGMVEKHGGLVSFRSRTDVPSGTVFRIYLPRTGATDVFGAQSPAVLQ